MTSLPHTDVFNVYTSDYLQGEYTEFLTDNHKSKKEKDLERIYMVRNEDQIHENTDMLHLIGRALVDQSFFKYVQKLPKLLETYQNKAFEQDYAKYHVKLETRVKQTYW